MGDRGSHVTALLRLDCEAIGSGDDYRVGTFGRHRKNRQAKRLEA